MMKSPTSNLAKHFLSLVVCLLLFSSAAASQTVVDKTVATVSDNVRTELITYSDLLWQLALQPGTNLSAPTGKELEETLQLVIEQRLIALEAQRLPAIEPTDAEVKEEIRRIVDAFPSAAVFVNRLFAVGFDSIEDPNFQRIIEQRVAIEKYLDFRFRSFVVVTPEEEQRYYNEVFAPQFRRNNPGVVLPPLETTRANINLQLSESKIEADIDRFMEEAKNRAVITMLEPL